MALIVKEAASLSSVNPLRLLGRGRGKEMGQNELKRFTSTCAAGKMAWQWKSCRKADFGPVGHSINTGIREKRAWLCIQASTAAVYIIPPWQYKELLWVYTHTATNKKQTKKSTFTVKQWINVLCTEKQTQQNKHKLAQWTNYDRCT